MTAALFPLFYMHDVMVRIIKTAATADHPLSAWCVRPGRLVVLGGIGVACFGWECPFLDVAVEGSSCELAFAEVQRPGDQLVHLHCCIVQTRWFCNPSAPVLLTILTLLVGPCLLSGRSDRERCLWVAEAFFLASMCLRLKRFVMVSPM